MDSRITRRLCFEALFQMEFHEKQSPEEVAELYLSRFDRADMEEIEIDGKKVMLNEVEQSMLKVRILDMVSHLEEVDTQIEKASKGWEIGRLGKEELALLREGIYEIMYDELEDAIVANEIVELSKVYLDEKGTSFINGILGTVIRGK